jgi:hypothetical protein
LDKPAVQALIQKLQDAIGESAQMRRIGFVATKSLCELLLGERDDPLIFPAPDNFNTVSVYIDAGDLPRIIADIKAEQSYMSQRIAEAEPDIMAGRTPDPPVP